MRAALLGGSPCDGSFYVVNHGVPQPVVDELFAVSRDDAGGSFPEWLVELAKSGKDAPGCSHVAART